LAPGDAGQVADQAFHFGDLVFFQPVGELIEFGTHKGPSCCRRSLPAQRACPPADAHGSERTSTTKIGTEATIMSHVPAAEEGQESCRRWRVGWRDMGRHPYPRSELLTSLALFIFLHNVAHPPPPRVRRRPRGAPRHARTRPETGPDAPLRGGLTAY